MMALKESSDKKLTFTPCKRTTMRSNDDEKN
jgi:hypothetical protein